MTKHQASSPFCNPATRALGRLVPDHKTTADFRKDNGLVVRKACARFVELCRDMELLATMSVIIDKVERRRAQLECDVSEEGTMRNRNAELDARGIARTPPGRLGTIDDIGRIICVLAGDESGFKRRETENPKPRSIGRGFFHCATCCDIILISWRAKSCTSIGSDKICGTLLAPRERSGNRTSRYAVELAEEKSSQSPLH